MRSPEKERTKFSVSCLAGSKTALLLCAGALCGISACCATPGQESGILPCLDEKSTAWEFRSTPALSAERSIAEGEVAIQTENQGCGTIGTTGKIAVRELTPYALRFTYRTSGEVNRFHDKALRVTVIFHGDREAMGAAGGESVRTFDFEPSGKEREITIGGLKLLTPITTESVSVSFSFSGNGELKLSSPSMREIPFPDGVLRAGKRIWKRTRVLEDPPADYTPEERKRGWVVYRREPSRIAPESRPGRGEITDALRKFTVPGEYCNLHFVLHTFRGVTLDSFQVSMLRSADGKHEIAPEAWELFHVPFRNKPAWSSTEYFTIPEVLYPFEPLSAGKDANTFLWMQARLPEDTPAGFYRGTVRLTGKNLECRLPVVLRVLPFTLRKPPADWIMYGGSFWAGGYRNNRRADIQKKHFEEIASYGQTGMIHHGGIYTEQAARILCERLEAVGMRGPLVIDFGWGLEGTMYRNLYGKNLSDHRRFPYPECKDPKLADAFVEHLRKLDSWMKKHFKGSAWYYQGLDEPHIYGGLSQAAWEYPLAKKAGVRTSSTVYPYREFVEFGKWGLDVSVNGNVKFSKEYYDRLSAAAKRQRTKLWLLGPGSYVPGTGITNRYQSGFLFYRTGLPACVAWTYGAGPDRDELEFGRMSYYMVYARKEFGGSRKIETPVKRVSNTTLAGEGLREGVTDYKYAYTLERMIRSAREQGRNSEADRAEKFLGQLKGEMIPFWNEVDKNGVMDEPAMEKIRWAAAQEIMLLREVCK